MEKIFVGGGTAAYHAIRYLFWPLGARDSAPRRRTTRRRLSSVGRVGTVRSSRSIYYYTTVTTNTVFESFRIGPTSPGDDRPSNYRRDRSFRRKGNIADSNPRVRVPPEARGYATIKSR